MCIGMNLLWIFAAVAPLGRASLFVFAMHIDPLSGHWRTRQDKRHDDESASASDA